MRAISAAAAALVMGLAGLSAAPAAATVYTITYTGKVGYGFTLTDMFGMSAGSLNNLDYSLTYFIDDAAAGATHTTTPTMTEITGSGPNSPVHAAITINDVTYTINGSQEGGAEQIDLNHGNDGGSDFVRQNSFESDIDSHFYHVWTAETYVTAAVQDFLSSADYRAPFTFDPLNTNGIYNLVQLNDFNYDTQQQVNYAYMNLGVGGISTAILGGPSGAPEPVSWALMIMGFGGVGGMLRRRRWAFAGL